jgi:hypothetical protein
VLHQTRKLQLSRRNPRRLATQQLDQIKKCDQSNTKQHCCKMQQAARGFSFEYGAVAAALCYVPESSAQYSIIQQSEMSDDKHCYLPTIRAAPL